MNYDLKDILNKIDSKEIREFLYDNLINNDYLLNKFRIKFNNFFPKLSRSAYENKIAMAINNCANKRGYIEYGNTDSYECAMLEYLDEAWKLVSIKDFATAFTIVSLILDSIPKTDIDDSNGSTGMVADHCQKVMYDILDCLDNKDTLVKDILDYVFMEVKSLTLYNYGIQLYKMLEYFIQKKLYLEEITRVLQDFLEVNCEKSLYVRQKITEYLKLLGV